MLDNLSNGDVTKWQDIMDKKATFVLNVIMYYRKKEQELQKRLEIMRVQDGIGRRK